MAHIEIKLTACSAANRLQQISHRSPYVLVADVLQDGCEAGPGNGPTDSARLVARARIDIVSDDAQHASARRCPAVEYRRNDRET